MGGIFISLEQLKKGGGLAFNAVCPLTKVDEKLVQLILHEYKIFNAEVRTEIVLKQPSEQCPSLNFVS